MMMNRLNVYGFETLSLAFIFLISWHASVCEPAIVMVRVVRMSVCHTRVSPKLSEIGVWLPGNSNKNPGFPIHDQPSDSRSEVQFLHFVRFRVGISSTGTLGTVSVSLG